MQLSFLLKKRFLQKVSLPIKVNGETVGTLSGAPLVWERETPSYCFLEIGTKMYADITVLIPEGEEVRVTVEQKKHSIALDVSGARVESVSLCKIFGALNDEGQISFLLPWERRAFFVLLYHELNREDAILESVYVRDVIDALFAVGMSHSGERLRRAVDGCEIDLPLDPMAKLSPEEETAIVESYHILWSEEEKATDEEKREEHLAFMEYFYKCKKENENA